MRSICGNFVIFEKKEKECKWNFRLPQPVNLAVFFYKLLCFQKINALCFLLEVR